LGGASLFPSRGFRLVTALPGRTRSPRARKSDGSGVFKKIKKVPVFSVDGKTGWGSKAGREVWVAGLSWLENHGRERRKHGFREPHGESAGGWEERGKPWQKSPNFKKCKLGRKKIHPLKQPS